MYDLTLIVNKFFEEKVEKVIYNLLSETNKDKNHSSKSTKSITEETFYRKISYFERLNEVILRKDENDLTHILITVSEELGKEVALCFEKEY
jgi:hypothetical protein